MLDSMVESSTTEKQEKEDSDDPDYKMRGCSNKEDWSPMGRGRCQQRKKEKRSRNKNTTSLKQRKGVTKISKFIFMISEILWNIIGVRSKKVIHRLKHLIAISKVEFIAIMEPFVRKEKIEGYRNFLGFHQCISNDNGQIWCFWTTNCQTTIITNEE